MQALRELERAAYLSGAMLTVEVINKFESLLEEREAEIKLLEKRIDALEEEIVDAHDEITELCQDLRQAQAENEDLAWRMENSEE